jgi:hypothetical protein
MNGYTLTVQGENGNWFYLVQQTITHPGDIVVVSGGLEFQSYVNGLTTSQTVTMKAGTRLSQWASTTWQNTNLVLEDNVWLASSNGTYTPNAYSQNIWQGPITVQGKVVNDLSSGKQVMLYGKVSGAGYFTGGNGGWLQFYDPANTANKWCTIQHQFDVNVDSTWYVLNMRLADDAPNVVGYNLKTANGDNNDRPVAAWTLHGSRDGETWILLDEQNLGTGAPTKANTWYNNGTPSTARGESFPIGNAEADVSADDVSPIGSLVVDLAETSGTLARFKPAANGALVILNAPVGMRFANWTVPLSVDEFSSDAATQLRTWSITVDGVALKYRLVVRNGNLVTAKKSGLVVFVR